jgi:methionyl-tRNA formyltransferase
MKIAILTTPNQWFVEYAKQLNDEITNSKLFFEHHNIKDFDIVFILSYHQIVPKEILKSNKHNIVIHESPLPQGKGWAPLFWQVLEGKNEIVFTMFEASDGVDNGPIYMQKILKLNGYELNEELREKQAKHTINMCKEFIKKYDKYKIPTPQNGVESFYPKRTSKDSELNVNKTIKEQFNLFRIVNNEEYPAFFEIDGHRYILKIEFNKNKGG